MQLIGLAVIRTLSLALAALAVRLSISEWKRTRTDKSDSARPFRLYSAPHPEKCECPRLRLLARRTIHSRIVGARHALATSSSVGSQHPNFMEVFGRWPCRGPAWPITCS